MNRVKGCFITIISIFVLVVLVLLCITLIDTGSTTGEGRSSPITQLFSSKDLLFLGLDESIYPVREIMRHLSPFPGIQECTWMRKDGIR